jgi:stage II sporulation protein Q
MEHRRLRRSTIYLLYSLGFVFLVGVAYFIENAFTTSSLDADTIYVSDTILEDVVKPVVADTQKIIRPYKDSEVKILKDYYDYQADEESQIDSIIVYNDTYLQNSGICYGGVEEFDVTAILDGTVIAVENDEILGNIVRIEHSDNTISVYQSLKDVTIKLGDMVAQGDIIGKAGTNNLNPDLGNHLHFELIVDGQIVDPENYFNE